MDLGCSPPTQQMRGPPLLLSSWLPQQDPHPQQIIFIIDNVGDSRELLPWPHTMPCLPPFSKEDTQGSLTISASAHLAWGETSEPALLFCTYEKGSHGWLISPFILKHDPDRLDKSHLSFLRQRNYSQGCNMAMHRLAQHEKRGQKSLLWPD